MTPFLNNSLDGRHSHRSAGFNMTNWGGNRLREDARWKFGVPLAGNANYAGLQHFICHLAPTILAGFVLAIGRMSSSQSRESETCGIALTAFSLAA